MNSLSKVRCKVVFALYETFKNAQTYKNFNIFDKKEMKYIFFET